MSKFCFNCGANVNDNAFFCSVCGTNVSAPVRQPVKRQPVPGRGQGIASMILGFVNCDMTVTGLILFVFYLMTKLGAADEPDVAAAALFILLAVIFKIAIVVTLCFSVALSVIGVILGHLSRSKNYKRQSTVGLLCGYINVAFIALISLLIIFF